jgi:DNA-binding NtrC family response regulator
MHYSWPGNVRELQNVMERAAVLVDGPTVMSVHLPERLQALVDKDAAQSEAASFKLAKQQAVEFFERTFLLDLLKRNDGHMSRAAREAGVDRKTIERMVKKHGLRDVFWGEHIRFYRLITVMPSDFVQAQTYSMG